MTHLELLNAVLALRFEQPGWPSILKEGGYQVHGVLGVTFLLADGRQVAPDVLTSSPERRVALLVEIKSGANIDHDQAGRLEAVTVEDLRDRAYLHVPDLPAQKIGVLYLCPEAQAEAVARALWDRPFTVLSFDGSSFKKRGADLPDLELQKAWLSATVDPRSPPAQIVPFDRESEVAAVARHVLPVLVALLTRGVGTFDPDDVLRLTHSTCLEAMKPTGSRSELQDLRRAVRDVLNHAVGNELSEVLGSVRSNPGRWQFIVPLPAEQKAKTGMLQQLQKKCAELLERLGGGEELQGDLFSDSD